MNIVAGMLGLMGGLAGIIGSYFALTGDGIGLGSGAAGTDTIIAAGCGALFFALLGMIGGGIAFTRPRLAAYLMLAGGGGGAACIARGYIVAAALLLTASALAFAVKGKDLPNVNP